MDYKALLQKYMQLIVDCESVTYVMGPQDRCHPDKKTTFTDEEWTELQRIGAMTMGSEFDVWPTDE